MTPGREKGAFQRVLLKSLVSPSQFSFFFESFETSNVCLDTDTKQLSSTKNKIACDFFFK